MLSGIVLSVVPTTYFVPDSKRSLRLKPQLVRVKLRANKVLAENSLDLKLLLM